MVVYLDCAASMPLDPRVRDLLLTHLAGEPGNAGSRTHDFGARARRSVEHARDQVAAAAGAGRGEVLFTSGATESNNLALLGLAEHGRATGRRHVVGTAIEHRSVLEPLGVLARQGFEVTLIPPTAGGWVEPRAVREAVRPDTLLVTVMQVNNETGVRQPVEEIAGLLSDHPAFFHVDAAQGFGREPAVGHPRIDLVSVSGHKLNGPQGVGALIARRRRGDRPPLTPLAYGGGQELGLRPGTLPVALIAALGLAAELAVAEAEARAARCRQFRARLLSALAPLAPVLHGDQERVLPHIMSLSVPGVPAEELMEGVREEIAISDGAACSSHSETCSHVLGAMRLDPALAEGAVRLSWCHLTEEPDWDQLLRSLLALVDPVSV